MSLKDYLLPLQNCPVDDSSDVCEREQQEHASQSGTEWDMHMLAIALQRLSLHWLSKDGHFSKGIQASFKVAKAQSSVLPPRVPALNSTTRMKSGSSGHPLYT